jgi:branched-chain amino acid transport system permease protein
MKKKFQWNYIFLLFIVIALVIFPYVSESRTWTILLTQIFIFSILAMSYDILLGYTGIVSFGHAMFFGMGAYTTAVMLKRMEPTIGVFVLSIAVGMVIAGIVSFFIGLLTLRLKTHFFAMLTLAVSGLFLVLAEKWRTVTYGNDGFTFKAPEIFKDRIVFYFVTLFCLVLVYLFLRRFVNSPFGRVLVAVRENEQRTNSLGFNTLHYKVIASIVAGVIASLGGSLYAISLRFVNTSVLSLDITLDALLMTIIGGVGTLI